MKKAGMIMGFATPFSVVADADKASSDWKVKPQFLKFRQGARVASRASQIQCRKALDLPSVASPTTGSSTTKGVLRC
jgi:hypothetical protein